MSIRVLAPTLALFALSACGIYPSARPLPGPQPTPARPAKVLLGQPIQVNIAQLERLALEARLHRAAEREESLTFALRALRDSLRANRALLADSVAELNRVRQVLRP